MWGSREETRSRSGLSLVEVMVAMAVIVVSVLGFSRSILSSVRMSDTEREVMLATEGARRTIETLQATDFDDVFKMFNVDTADDPVPDSPGAAFVVDGLTRRNGAPVGRIVFPALNADPADLREDLNYAQLGMPRDLNGDGAVDANPHQDDYRILPVLVRIEWDGAAGGGKLEFKTKLGSH